MNSRSRAGGFTKNSALLAVLAASLVFTRNAFVVELAVAAACILLRPRLGGLLGILLVGLSLLPLVSMLPASWFGEPVWRISALGAETPLTMTPQPWAFLSVWASYLSGLVFLWWVSGLSDPSGLHLRQRDTDNHVCTQKPSHGQDAPATCASGRGRFAGESAGRHASVLVFATAVSAMLIFSRWESGGWRGPYAALFAALFDTRNQAASFAAIALGGCAVHAVGMRETRWRQAWLLASVLCVTALLVLGSRGGLMAAAAGCLTGWSILLSSQKRSWRAGLIIGAAVAVGGLVVLMLPSVPLLDRFAAEGASGLGFRMAVQSDAWRMLAAHPLSGVGLGSFDGVFPFFRSLSASIWRTVHPESDWLWFACEAGVLAGLLALGVGILLAGRWWKVALGGDPVPAAVGLACLAAMAVHGILDVPAHSGPVWFLAAALAGVGLRSPPSAGRPVLVPIVVFLLLGGLAVGQFLWTPAVRPPVLSVDRPLDVLPGMESVKRWLRFRPLDVGVVEVAAHQAIRSGDHARARVLLARLFVLEPFSPLPATRAMGVLVERGDNDLAARCAEAILARSPPDGRGEKLNQLLKEFSGNPSLSQALLVIPPSTAAWQATRIEFMKTPILRTEFELFLKLASSRDDPGIDENPASRVLSLALASGCPDLVEKAAALPILRRASFRARAAWAGSKGNPAEACQIVTENLAPPLDKIDVAFPEGADAYGLTMKALVEWRAGNYEKSRLLLSAAAPQKDAPPLAWYLLGCAEYRNGAHERAWDAFQKFLSAGDGVNGPR